MAHVNPGHDRCQFASSSFTAWHCQTLFLSKASSEQPQLLGSQQGGADMELESVPLPLPPSPAPPETISGRSFSSPLPSDSFRCPFLLFFQHDSVLISAQHLSCVCGGGGGGVNIPSPAVQNIVDKKRWCLEQTPLFETLKKGDCCKRPRPQSAVLHSGRATRLLPRFGVISSCRWLKWLCKVNIISITYANEPATLRALVCWINMQPARRGSQECRLTG